MEARHRKIPGLWSIFGRKSVVLPRSVAGLEHLAEGTNVDIEGPGEILRITALADSRGAAASRSHPTA